MAYIICLVILIFVMGTEQTRAIPQDVKLFSGLFMNELELLYQKVRFLDLRTYPALLFCSPILELISFN